MRTIILATMLVATPAAADQFDLVCQSQYSVKPGGRTTAREIRFRIDLSVPSWCRDKCTKVEAIQAVEQGKIVLYSSSPDTLRRVRSFAEIDRVSGAYRDYSGGIDSYWDERGSCAVAPFSGFPTTKF